ncbi:MAG: LPS assembly lipoprotein LptE [Endomicrobium sp.]|jgi:hypothetical protein|nr:LPS assembly lipoprotein LptE [Endomicrobium sp.]
MKFNLFLFMSLILFSCTAYSSHNIQKDNLKHVINKKIYVDRYFINSTNKFGFETKFANAVIDELLNDGCFSIVNTKEDADVILNVIVKKYILEPLTYDINDLVKQYKLYIVASITLINRYDNAIILSNPRIEGVQIFEHSIAGYNSIGDEMSEEEAREFILEKMSKIIVKKIIKRVKFTSQDIKKIHYVT